VNKYLNGMLSGFVATIALSVMMLAKGAMGAMPQLDVVEMLSSMMGMPQVLLSGWMAHFIIGTVVWGVLFALLVPKLPSSSYTVKGIVFGILVWGLMMIFVMPMAGAGLFGLALGPMASVATLVLHIVYGAVLGFVYSFSAGKTAQTMRNSAG